ncbi:MAG: hypothetical protein J0H29_16845 [Sphingobacteriales bacterium]|nr:hypothetical protein [Sphingobacteriales bacterium]OJY86152.1 MAG: hypothetical protein BGP14_16880 [Sphingobacteriales bacterium 44-15]
MGKKLHFDALNIDKELTLLIAAGSMICFACNESPDGTATKPANTNDSGIHQQVTELTPGLGYDPTGNDTRKKDQ